MEILEPGVLLNLATQYVASKTSHPTHTCFVSYLQEKVKGKNKLVPRLLGVNKDSVVRVDLQTKEVMYPILRCQSVIRCSLSSKQTRLPVGNEPIFSTHAKSQGSSSQGRLIRSHGWSASFSFAARRVERQQEIVNLTASSLLGLLFSKMCYNLLSYCGAL